MLSSVIASSPCLTAGTLLAHACFFSDDTDPSISPWFISIYDCMCPCVPPVQMSPLVFIQSRTTRLLLEVVTYCLRRNGAGGFVLLEQLAGCKKHRKYTGRHHIFTPSFFAGVILWCQPVYRLWFPSDKKNPKDCDSISFQAKGHYFCRPRCVSSGMPVSACHWFCTRSSRRRTC